MRAYEEIAAAIGELAKLLVIQVMYFKTLSLKNSELLFVGILS